MPSERRISVAEFFCGIGGCTAALGEAAEVVAAIDIDRTALNVYAHNFSGPVVNREIETIETELVASWQADLWWLSPPCQPYTTKGNQRDLDDPRARSLVRMTELIRAIRPRYVALENVPGFVGSRAHRLVLNTLDELGYNVAEHLICPSELGWPNRRKRFYLVATQHDLLPLRMEMERRRPLAELIEPEVDSSHFLPPEFIAQHRAVMHCVSPADRAALTACFTANYGRSRRSAGSYLSTAQGIRYFTPREIARLLGFPESFAFPTDVSRRTAWSLLGNSLSAPVVRAVLSTIPEFAGRTATVPASAL